VNVHRISCLFVTKVTKEQPTTQGGRYCAFAHALVSRPRIECQTMSHQFGAAYVPLVAQRILCVQFGRIGETLWASDVLHMIRRCYLKSHISFLLEEQLLGLSSITDMGLLNHR
jgi:hypothetical protein